MNLELRITNYELRIRILLFLAEAIGPFFLGLLGRWCRYRIINEDNFTQAQALNKGVILTLWHGRMLVPIYHLRGRGITSLVSLSLDGEIIARIVQKIGYIARRGSPKEGGREGFLAMLHDLRENRVVAIFPDGPTGPRHSVRDGVVHLARLTQAPIVPMIFSGNPCWRARSWDRFMIPKPLSKGVIIYGEPFYLPRKIKSETELENCRELVRRAVNRIERQADEMMGIKTDSEDISG